MRINDFGISIEGLSWLWRYRRCWREFKRVKDEEESGLLTLQLGESVTFGFEIDEIDKPELSGN